MDKEILNTPRQSGVELPVGEEMRFFKRKTGTEQVGPVVDEPTPPFMEVAPDPRSGFEDLTVGDYAQGVPQIRIGEMLRVFTKQLPLAFVIFGIGTGLSWWFTKDIKRSWAGEGRVLAQISSEYVYEPVAGQTAPGILLTPDHIVLNEVGIMTSPSVIKRVMENLIDQYGPGRVDEVNVAKARAGENLWDNPDIYATFEKRFAASPRAKSSIIDLSFKHEDPEIAVAGLNMFLTEYMRERQTIFVSEAADIVSKRREATELQLSRNESEIAATLRRNNVSDFESEREGATERTEELKTTLNTLRGEIVEAETALTSVEIQLRETPATINLFVDDRASQRVAQAELELKHLLAKYLPGSDPVRQKQTEIAELKSLQAANGGRAAGGRRVGPNPVYQELLERRNTLAAQANALREKEGVVQGQLNGADAKTRALRDLSPRMENLLRERETLQARLRTLNTREQEALINQQQAQSESENVHVISRAETARKGSNMKAILLLLGMVASAGVAFLIALLRTFLDPRLYARPERSTHVRVETRSRGRRADDHVVIPEPVRPFAPATPAPPPYPDVQPAAATDPVFESVSTPEAPLVEAAPVVATGSGPEVFAESFAHNYQPRVAQAAETSASTPTLQASSDNPYMTGNVAQLFNPPQGSV